MRRPLSRMSVATMPDAVGRKHPECRYAHQGDACLGPEADLGEVLHQLSLDVVGEAPAVCGNEAPGLTIGAALVRMLDGRENAPNNALGARQRAP
jgi:hypothetical protein